jgi:hypothetical protein
MKFDRVRNVVASIVLAAAAGTLPMGCATEPPQPLNMENVASISATVVSIDLANRLVALKGPAGRIETVEVPASVRNLAQVQVGDAVVVRYYESIAATIRPKGASTTLDGADQALLSARAPSGSKPGAAIGNVSTATVIVQAVDSSLHTVTFFGPDGLVRSVQVRDPKAQTFVASLKKGDEVELTYTEALAVSVDPVAK